MRKYRNPIIREMQPEDLAEIANWEKQFSNDKQHLKNNKNKRK